MAMMVQSGDVYLAYAERNREIALKLAGALEAHDISVAGTNESIPVGVNWADYLSEQVSAARCVIVLWSTDSVEDRRVLHEAETALRRRVLIPAVIERVKVPDSFSYITSADLTRWEGNPSDTAFEQLLGAVERLLETAPTAAEEARTYKVNQRTAERRAEELFQRNLGSQSTIEHIELGGTAFYDELGWNLNPGINVLLGRNGYGKTYLLRGILALLQYNDDVALDVLGHGNGTIGLLRDGQEELIHFSNQFFDEEGAVGKLPILAIPDMRFINRSLTALSASSDETTGRGDRADLGRFGAWHFLQERPYEGMIQTFLYGLCLDYFERGLRFEGEHFELIRDVVRELTDRSFDFDRVAREGRDRFTLYVRTEGNEDNPLPIQKSSQGTSSVIAMFGLIYDFLKSLRQSTEEIRNRSGIVLIDEVDAHLHPVWQQKIVTLLRDRFPQVQFILSAHNPIVIAGCLEDEVSVLRKDPESGFSLVQFPNDFVGWQTEAIYRKVFEIENPDANFTRYNAMRPFKGQLKQQAVALAGQSTRSDDEERSLDAIEEKLLYIEKVEQARAERISGETLERENRMLRDRLLGLESAHEAAAEAQRKVDALKEELARERTENLLNRSRAQTMRLAAGVLLIAAIILLLIVLLR